MVSAIAAKNLPYYATTHMPMFNSGLNGISFSGKNSAPLFGVNQDAEYQELQAKLQEIENNNGSVLKAWDTFKNAVNVGARSEKCDEAIENYKKGEVTFEEAMETIEKYKNKQDGSLNLFSNIVTSIAAIGAVTAAAAVVAATGGAALPIVAAGLIGAGVGGATKAGFKLFDRATNKVDGDAFNAKQIVKDGLSGAVTGAIASVTMGTAGATYTEGAKLTTNIGKAALRCAKRNAVSGAVAGSANYAIDCTFDDNQKMTAKGFVANTVQGAAVGAVVGAVMGTHNTVLRHAGLLKSGGQVGAINDGKAAFSSGNDIAANSICTAEYKITTQAIKNATGLS